MIELSHSLLLNEDALSELTENKKPLFVFEWLRFLNRVLPVAQKADIKGCQQRLVEQLNNQIACCSSPAARKLLASCLAVLFTVGDTYSLFQTINFCNDLIKNKDDSPSYLPAKLNAICCLGAMYEKLGRMVGRSFEETAQILIKCLKNAESQGRVEIMRTFEKMTRGLGSAIDSVIRKDVYKAARSLLTDRSMLVRCAAARCLEELCRQTQFVWSQELDNVASSCFKALDSSNYEVRRAIARLLGTLLALGHNPKLCGPYGIRSGGVLSASESSHSIGGANTHSKCLSLEDCWAILASGLLRGALGFYRNGSCPTGAVAVEIRVGITMAYVDFLAICGPAWLERNSMAVLSHLMDLAASPAKSSSNVQNSDCLFIRNCVCYIIRRTFGQFLKEQAQIAICRDLGQIIAENMNSIDVSIDSSLSRSLTYEHAAGQQIIVVALLEMSHLIRIVGGAISSIFLEASGIIEPVFAVLLHPCLPCRVACAWCLRCLALAVPSLLTPLIDRCVNRLEHQKTSYDAICGYTLSLSSLLCSVPHSTLGIPSNKWKQLSAVAEEFLRTASQASRLTLVKTQGAWLLYASLMNFGPSVVKNLLPKLLLLWKSSFPRSTKDADAEKQRGDYFTWQVTLESRIGALATMQYFLSNCGELASEEVLRRLINLLEPSLVTLGYLPQICKQLGSGLKTSASLMRLRFYLTMQQINPKFFENLFSLLLRELVADFTLTDNTSTVLCTAYRNGPFYHLDGISLKNQYHSVEHANIENAVSMDHLSYLKAIENDVFDLCRSDIDRSSSPGTLPTSVAVIDASILLFGNMFPFVANKHRLQMLDHFNECLKGAKANRQLIIHTNVTTALLYSLKALADNKMTLDNENVIKALVSFFTAPLSSPNLTLKCCAAEALGRLAQLVVEPRFFNDMVQYCVEKLKLCRDEANRTGHSLALGCLHQCVGGLSTQHNLNTTVGILLALAQDASSVVVQIWSTYALGLVASACGPVFRSYVNPVLVLCTKNLLTSTSPDFYYCNSKLIGALILVMGPELHSNSAGVAATRTDLLSVVAMLAEFEHPAVKAEAISCLQQMHLFASRHVNVSTLVPLLCNSMKSNHIALRKISASCLRQLVQREAKEVCEHASNLMPQGMMDKKASVLPESGLEGALFCLIDTETDPSLLADVKETLISLLQHTVADQLSQWLAICKDILVASSSDSTFASAYDSVKIVRSVGGGSVADDAGPKTAAADEQHEDDTMRVSLSGGVDDDDEARKSAASVWRDFAVWPSPTASRRGSRAFAVELVRKTLRMCRQERAHFDLALAKELQLSGGRSDYLVLHLSDLIRMSFMASTSNDIDLRLIGLACLQDVIVNFSNVPEPEFPGHVILEQFQAQVGAALRPAFTPETPSHVTAAACQVCSTWIGCGVARDLNDLRRVHQLLTFSLEKLNKGSNSSQLYNESAATLEKLSILKAWAEVYIVAIKQEVRQNRTTSSEQSEPETTESLLNLVKPELPLLVSGWLQALHQWALLTLPPEYAPQIENRPIGGADRSDWSIEPAVQSHYRGAWPQILLAAATWLRLNDFSGSDDRPIDGVGEQMTKNERFTLLLGECLGALCSPKLSEKIEIINLCLESIDTMLKCRWAQLQLTRNVELIVETLNIIYKQILTNNNYQTHLLCANVFDSILNSCDSSIEVVRGLGKENGFSRFAGNEGSESGQISSKSVTFAGLEVCLCRLALHMPSINNRPAASDKKLSASALNKYYNKLASIESQNLISRALKSLIRLPSFCAPEGILTILLSILHIIISALRELSKLVLYMNNNAPQNPQPALATSLYCLRYIISRPVYCGRDDGAEGSNDSNVDPRWTKIIQAALWSVLDILRSNTDGDQVDHVTIMLATSIFLVACPAESIAAANLIHGCVEVFKRCLVVDSTNDNSSSVLKTLQSLQSIFGHKDKRVSSPFIKLLTPLVIENVKSFIKSGGGDETVPNLAVLMESEKTLELTVAAACADRRYPLVSMIAQILCSFLPPMDCSNLRAKSGPSELTEFALHRLNKFAPDYPDEFRRFVRSSPDFKQRLENALRLKQEQISVSDQRRLSKGDVKPIASNKQQQPAITLKTNFAQFT